MIRAFVIYVCCCVLFAMVAVVSVVLVRVIGDKKQQNYGVMK